MILSFYHSMILSFYRSIILCFYDSMIFMFRTRTWVPGCLGGRSRGAWAASPGLLGRLPGAPRGGVPAPNYKAQLVSLPLVDPSNLHQNL